MDIVTVLLIIHLFGFAWGIGGATVSDVLFFKSIKDRSIDNHELATLGTVSRVVIGGITVSVLSGLALLVFQYTNTGGWHLLSNAQFQAKFTLVAIIIANGVIFHRFVFPLMGKYVDKSLNNKEINSKLWLFAATGGVSVTSWYGAALLAFLRNLDLPYLLIINAYLVAVSFAMVGGYLMLSRTIFPKGVVTATGFSGLAQRAVNRLTVGGEVRKISKRPTNKEREKRGPSPHFSMKGALLGTSLVFVVLMATVISYSFYVSSPDTRTHYVCINEAPPWFGPDVLEISVGDTVVWEHCHEEMGYGDHAHADSIFINQVIAHEGHNGHFDTVHTHPILSISGPEVFSSHFRPVGHLEDGNDFSFTFTEEGVYEYICPTHPYMKGIIAVGVESPVDSLWPPEENISPELLSLPEIPGVGEIWVNTQFEKVSGQTYPGTITVIDAQTWEVTDTISNEDFNNPHNLWHSYDEGSIFQTQWHSDGFSKIDVETREILSTVRPGNAPAHVFVHPNKDRIYVTINNESHVAVLNSELEEIGRIETSFGPHGIWIDPSGKWMSIAATLEEKLDIIDLDSPSGEEEVVATFDASGLPLATAITHDGKYAMISLLLEGVVRFVDLETLEVVRDVEVGTMPIWPSPGPNGEYVFVPNTGTADISVISLETLEVVKTLPAAAGAHGIIFGPKEGGGHYGYFSNKFARIVGVIDVEELELVGHIPLPETAWGGNGILVLPNSYDDFIPQQ